MKEPLLLGTYVHPWGHISGVTNHGGERYYFFSEKGVALIPGWDVERMARKQETVKMDNGSSITFVDNGEPPLRSVDAD
jgi:hypothetical protein